MRVDPDTILTDAQLKRELRGYKPPKAGPAKIIHAVSIQKNPCGNIKCRSGAVATPVDLHSIKRSYARN